MGWNTGVYCAYCPFVFFFTLKIISSFELYHINSVLYVHLCRMKQFAIAGKEMAVDGTSDGTTEWRDSCATTFMTTVCFKCSNHASISLCTTFWFIYCLRHVLVMYLDLSVIF